MVNIQCGTSFEQAAFKRLEAFINAYKCLNMAQYAQSNVLCGILNRQ